MTTTAPGRPGSTTFVLVGLGPRGAGLLERLVSNAGSASDRSPVDVHVVDPYPTGGGRVWRDDQSALLRLNTTAEDLTAFVDDSVAMAGPVAAGPTLFEWCETHGVDLLEPDLADEAGSLGPLDFPTRRLASAYFTFALERTRRRAPDWLRILTHQDRAVDLVTAADGDAEVVVLADGTTISADAVVLLNSHVDVAPAPDFARLARFATAHGLTYLPPGYGGDLDLRAVEAGQDTIVRGFGLGFVDLMVLLTEGRGGRFVAAGGGRLAYLPSRREPHLLVGSRRGVPYHCKPMYHLQAGKPTSTAFCTPAAVGDLLRRGTTINFRTDLWPLIEREVSWAYYHELALGHPGRVLVPWSDFAATFAELTWGSAAYDRWIDSVVPDPADRLDLLALDRPLTGLAPGDADTLSETLRAYVRADVDRRNDVTFSADLGAFHALLAVLPVVAPALGSPLLDPRSLVGDFYGWFMGFFSFYASGPPPDRLEQLLALEEAGVLSFLGPELEVGTDGERGVFVARTAGLVEEVRAPALIDATLPAFDLGRTTDPLLAALARRGELATQVLTAPDGARIDTGQVRVDGSLHAVRADGSRSGRVFAAGMHTMIKSAAFARPGSNGPVHRQNDQLARTLLDLRRSPPTDRQPDPLTALQTDTDPTAALSGAGGR